MSIRLRTEEFFTHVRSQARMAILTSGSTIDAKTAEARFDPFLRSVWETASQHGKTKLDGDALQAAFDTAARAAIGGAAGVGRSATWVSRDEAEKLPDGLRQAWVAARAQKEHKLAYAQALHEPFPLGKADGELFFDRHLSMVHKRAAQEIFEASGLLAALPALESKVKKAGKLEVGDITIHAAPGKDEFKLHGKKFWSYGATSTLVFERAGDAVAVGWAKDQGGLLEPKLRMLRFGVDDHERDPRAGTSYDPPGSSLEDLIAKLGVKTGLPAAPKLSDDEALFKRFSQVDVAGLATVALGLLRANGGDAQAEARVSRAAARAHKKDAALIPELAARADFLGMYRQLAEHVKAHGEIAIGDMDGTVKIADTFERHHYDSEDDDATVTLVSGKGPLLIVDNSFGGLGHAIPLAALEKGELDVYLAQRSTARGRLHRDAAGKSESAPDPVMAQRLTSDLLEFLPATLESAQEDL